MTQEDKKLLLEDLSARLPYGVVLSTPNGNNPLLALVSSKKYNTIIEYDDYRGNENDISEWDGGDIEFIKPYLRSMSSMTEEERKEYELLANRCISTSVGFIHFEAQELINWLLKNHFDFRGLIEKGLAIEVNESNNPYK